MDVDVLRERSAASVRRWADRLVALSHDLHAHPELAWQEHRSAAACARLLTEAGIPVEVGAHGLDTAFRGDAGTSGPIVVLCCEYDALPELGHACAHNVIATAGIGAAIALASVAADVPVRVRVLGTPAEEDTGGKLDLLAAGAFDGAAAALMIHAYRHDVADFQSFAAETLTARIAGGGAADALAVATQAVEDLRPTLPPRTIVRPVPSTPPAPSGGVDVRPTPVTSTLLRYDLRALDGDRLASLRETVQRAVATAAEAAGATVTFVPDERGYAEFRGHSGLAATYQRHAESLGRGPFHPGHADACSDMGNVSWQVPSLHAMVRIGDGHPHEPEFADLAVGPAADRAIVESAIAMAWTAIDVATGAIADL